MKALVLAAGYGKRLQPITNNLPKSMVKIDGVPLLINTLNILTDCGISEIGIVVGHMADYIKNELGDVYKDVPIIYYENKRYFETNNVVSLYNAIEFCDDDMLMMECDILCKKDLIDKFLKSKGDCSIMVSPFNPKTMNGTVIKIKEDKAEELILGQWQDRKFDYSGMMKTVNIYRFTKSFAIKYSKLIKWYVEYMGENSYYEKILGSMIYYRENDFRVFEVSENMWCEIDTIEDLVRAKEKFKKYKTN